MRSQIYKMLPKIILKYEGIEMIANTKDKVKNAPTGFDNEKENIGIFLSINLFPKSKKNPPCVQTL